MLRSLIRGMGEKNVILYHTFFLSIFVRAIRVRYMIGKYLTNSIKKVISMKILKVYEITNIKKDCFYILNANSPSENETYIYVTLIKL